MAKGWVAFKISTLQEQEYIFRNEEIQNLVYKYAKNLNLSSMSQAHNQISVDEKDVSEVKIHIMKKSFFSKAQVYICCTGKDKNWHSENIA